MITQGQQRAMPDTSGGFTPITTPDFTEQERLQ